MKSNSTFTKNISTTYIRIICFALYSFNCIDINATTTINLKLFIQGYYDVSNSQIKPVRMIQGCPAPNSSTVTTLINVQLISSTMYSVVASTQAILNTDGTCVVTFSGNYSGPYYLNISGCNLLSSCSVVPVGVGTIPVTYDFTTASANAYGSNQIEMSPGVWALFSGDLNQDGNIDLYDLDIIYSNIFNWGCTCNDVDGDGNVGMTDLTIVANNVASFQYSMCL
jgi:hypothetical protein